jgi:hypothetical protein
MQEDKKIFGISTDDLLSEIRSYIVYIHDAAIKYYNEISNTEIKDLALINNPEVVAEKYFKKYRSSIDTIHKAFLWKSLLRNIHAHDDEFTIQSYDVELEMKHQLSRLFSNIVDIMDEIDLNMLNHLHEDLLNDKILYALSRGELNEVVFLMGLYNYYINHNADLRRIVFK